jgi:alanine dehydrogenase
LRIGVPKEIKPDEYRVAMTPAGARELVEKGHEVLVETTAGEGSAFADEEYERNGARIVLVDQVWNECELVLKVKEPIAPEYPRLREGLVLFTYLHIAADEPLTRALVESGVTAVAYETVETEDRRLPLLAPMSEIAGRLASQAGAAFLEKPAGGRGLLLGGVPGVQPGRVLVIGGGIVGYNAAIIALGLGAQVTILDRSIDRMRYLDEILSGRVSLVMSSRLQIESSVQEADVVIGAVLVPGARAPTRAAASRRHDRRRTAIRCTWSTASSTTASPTCPAAFRSPRRRRSRTRRCRMSRRSPTTGSSAPCSAIPRSRAA